MNAFDHRWRPIHSSAALGMRVRLIRRLSPRRLMALPIAAVGFSIAVTEIGRLVLGKGPASGGELSTAAAWTVQGYTTGTIAILLLTAWAYAFCRRRWPEDAEDRLHLGLVGAWACIGWTAWMVFRPSGLDDIDAVPLLFIFALPVVAITVPLLWHAMLKLRQPDAPFWLVFGYLTITLLLQCWATSRAVEDPLHIYIAHSALIAAAVAIWLVVQSRPDLSEPPRATR